MQTKLSLTLEDAGAMMALCKRAAGDLGRAVSIAIVDEAGALLQFERMSGARAYTVDLALSKARAAAVVGVPSRMIASAAFNAGQGGLPVLSESACVGAVGVSGAAAEQDDAIAAAGLAAIAAADRT